MRISSTTSNAEIARNPHQPEAWRRGGSIALSLLLHDAPRHRVRRRFAHSTRRARHKHHRIYGMGYLVLVAPLRREICSPASC